MSGRDPKPPCKLNQDCWYSVIKNGKVTHASDCIHCIRTCAKCRQGQLWRRGRPGYPDILVPV